MRLLILMLAFAATTAGCRLLPPQDPLDTRDERVSSFRGGRYWTAPGGFGPEFWAK
ncbi:MAG TPA: hypothetical protein VK898_13705 [Chloroflexota bacterium]|nr:hypothetical protein [Chloroflexota bacterium]